MTARRRFPPRARELAQTARRRVERAVQRSANAAGYEFFRKHFSTPMPRIEALPDRLWTVPSELPGVDLRLAEAEAFLATELAPLLAEFRPPRRPQPDGGFWLENGGYGTADAETLWAMLRHLRPSRVIELGSGASSHVIAKAAHANAADGAPLIHRVYDPYPFGNPIGPVPSATVEPLPTEDVPQAIFDELGPGDVLFVDTTHTVKTGGDVVRIFLEILPRLQPGVVVHCHDIFLPYDYPRAWVVDRRVAWAEQYLLQAFLSFNREFEVILPLHALARAAPALLAEHVPSFIPGDAPGAFWMRRRQPPSPGHA